MEISVGLVIIQDNKILLGHPTGSKWYGTYSIPKGNVEVGENHLQTAIRETREEFGIEISEDEINLDDSGYINYTNNGETYKRVYFFIVEPKDKIILDPTKFNEIDWAGFLTKEEAQKRIFWRFKPLLQYLK